jgi:deoxyhypusine synthase
MKRRDLGPSIEPHAITGAETVVDLVDGTFFAYNAARLREACRLFTERMLQPDVTVGVSITGALTPAGLGMSALIPLVKAGFIDWIVSTGANLYHDTHFGLGMSMHQGTHRVDDTELRAENVVRIYDILFDYNVLLDTDAYFGEMIERDRFQAVMSTSEFHHLAGRLVATRQEELGLAGKSLLAETWRAGVPVYTSSPGDSSIGLGVAAHALVGNTLQFDVNRDVNESTAIVYDAKKHGQKSAVLVLGGGSPKNFILQTEPQIQEVMGLPEKGHDYFLQITDARPDTGGLSGATPAEAVSWGKIDPEQLPHAVVAYLDSTIGLPILTAYALGKREPRPLKRLYDRRDEMLDQLREDYLAVLREKAEGA